MQASERAAVELKLAKLSDDMLDVQSNVEEMHKAVKQLPGRLADNGSGGGAGEDVSFEKKGPGLGIVSVRRNQARGAAYISGRHIRHTYKAHINQARCAAYTCVCVCVCVCLRVCLCGARALRSVFAFVHPHTDTKRVRVQVQRSMRSVFCVKSAYARTRARAWVRPQVMSSARTSP